MDISKPTDILFFWFIFTFNEDLQDLVTMFRVQYPHILGTISYWTLKKTNPEFEHKLTFSPSLTGLQEFYLKAEITN